MTKIADRLPDPTPEDHLLLDAVMRIQTIVLEFVRDWPRHPSNSDHDQLLTLGRYPLPSPNPFYGQMQSGLRLEFYYGHPYRVASPWGDMALWTGMSDSGDPTTAYREMLGLLDATPSTPVIRTEVGEFGPWYDLRSLDGRPLPSPIRRQPQDFASYEAIQSFWLRLRASRQDAGALGAFWGELKTVQEITR